MKSHSNHSFISCLFPAIALALGGVASAADRYWDGTTTTADADGGNGTWNTANLNWDDAATAGADAFFTNNDNVFFGGSAGNVTFGGAVTAGTMTFSTAGYNLTGATGNLNYTFSGLTTLPTTGTTTFKQGANNNKFLFNGGIDLNGAAISINLRNTLNGSNPSTATGKITGNGTLTVTNELSGTSNTARLILSGPNDYSGSTVVNGAILDINSATALGTSTLTLNATVTGITTVIRNTSSGALTLSNNNAMNWNGDFLFSALSGRTGSSSGTTRDLNMGTGAVTLGGDRIVNVAANTLTVGGVIDDGANTYGLTKLGAGTLALTGNSTYGGVTTHSAGTLLVNGALGSSAVTVGSTATIGGSGDIAGSLAFDGASFFSIVDINDPLNVTGTVTFGTGFGLDNVTGWDYQNAAAGTYTLITGANVDLTNMDHVSLANALVLGNGNQAYFETGSLNVVIVPEPAAALLGGLGLLTLLRRRRA